MEKITEWLHDYWLVVLVGLGAAGFMWWQGQNGAQALAPVPEASVSTSWSSTASSTRSESVPKAGFVHIKGAVVHPGIYPVDGTTRWAAVVALAGGLTKDADVATVNLAAIAEDQASLLIPKVGESVAPSAATPTGGSTESASALVNLNTATEAELQTLSGIGPKKAADIIAYREEHGGFTAIEELKEVSGIGDKTFEKLAPLVTVGP
ncbi:helix-hairpin-helix domain-containing protein [Lacticaseibacillus sp. GG6-2]